MRSWTVWSAVSTMNCPLRSRNLGRGRGLVILAIGGLVQLPAEHTRSITMVATCEGCEFAAIRLVLQSGTADGLTTDGIEVIIGQ